jgi:ribonuclease J
MPAPRFDQLHRDPGPFFVALGGAGMFGANFYLYGSAGQWIAIDCGFALDSTPSGVNRVSVPSLAALERYDIKLSALLITHGHEDHIFGAALAARCMPAPSPPG